MPSKKKLKKATIQSAAPFIYDNKPQYSTKTVFSTHVLDAQPIITPYQRFLVSKLLITQRTKTLFCCAGFCQLIKLFGKVSKQLTTLTTGITAEFVQAPNMKNIKND